MREIPNHPDYSITENGRIYSKPRRDSLGHKRVGHWMTSTVANNGYCIVTLDKKYSLIHRLLLEAWVGPCPEGLEACHYNGVRSDNRLDNLRWDTRSSNAQDAVKHGTSRGLRLKGENHHNSKLKEHQVKWIKFVHESGLCDKDELADFFDVNESTIRDIIQKRTWKYLWKQ